MLQNGNTATGGSLPPLGTWNIKGSVPYACGLAGLATCYRDGTVWESFGSTVTGSGQGLLGSVLTTALGGLVVDNCSGLLVQILNYNNCVARNLASYLQTKPGGVTAPPGTPLATCTSLLCTALKPVTDGLSGVLNTLGSTLASTLSSVLGTQLGVSQLSVDGISCGNVRLVH